MKGLLKGFWWLFRLSKSVKYSYSYGLNEVCDKEDRKKDSVPRMWNRKEAAIVGLENDSVPCTKRSTARQHMDRSSERYSKRGR